MIATEATCLFTPLSSSVGMPSGSFIGQIFVVDIVPDHISVFNISSTSSCMLGNKNYDIITRLSLYRPVFAIKLGLVGCN